MSGHGNNDASSIDDTHDDRYNNDEARGEVPWIEAKSLNFSSAGDIKEKDDDDEIGSGNSNNDDDDDDVVVDDYMTNLFADPDPYDTFDFHYENPDVTITLAGHKAENGQTLHSTGLTIWRASSQLSDYLISNPQYVRGKRVLELGAGLGLCGILSYHLNCRCVVLTDGDTDVLANLRENVQRNCSGRKKTVEDQERERKEQDEAVLQGGDTKTTMNDKDDPTILCRQLVWGQNISGEFWNRIMGVVENNKERNKPGWSNQQQQQPLPFFDTLLGADIIYQEEILEPLWTTVAQLIPEEKEEATASPKQFLLSYARRNVSIDLVLETAARFGFVWTTPAEAEGVFLFTRRPR